MKGLRLRQDHELLEVKSNVKFNTFVLCLMLQDIKINESLKNNVLVPTNNPIKKLTIQ